MEAKKKLASSFATVTPLRPLKSWLGRAVRWREPAREVFGWPCAIVLALENGRHAYLLDFEHAVHAPSQLRFRLDPRILDAWLSGQAARVIVQSIFGELIVVGVAEGGDFEPGAPLSAAEAEAA